YVRDGIYDRSNYGTVTPLELQTDGTGSNRDVYLEFDLTGASATRTATLRIFAALTSTSSSSLNTRVFPVANTNWTESGLTWRTKPARGTYLTNVIVRGTTSAFYELDVSSYIRSQKGSGSNLVSLCLHNPSSSQNQRITLYSREAPANGPTLVVVCTNLLPQITTQPQSRTNLAGQAATFSAVASGSEPLSYCWCWNGVGLNDGGRMSGATTNALSIASVQASDAGDYTLVVTNSMGSVTSAVATLTVTVPGSCSPAPAGLISWWPGDTDAKDIVSTNNGTLQNGASINPNGFVGGAFSFDGVNDFVRIPDAPALRPANLTVEAWVLFTSLNSSGNSSAGQQYIVFKQNTRSSNFEGYYLGKTRRTGGDAFTFGVSSAAGQYVGANSTPLIKTGVWYHVAGVRGPNFIQLYVNGQLASQATVSFAQNYGNYPLYLGTSGQSYWDRKLAGLLDEVSLYSRALTATEIAAIYTAGRGGKCKTAPPTISLTAPTNNAAFVVAATILLQATASSSSGTIAKVEFFDGTNKLGEARSSPFAYSWQIPTAGSHSLSAKATDSP
ncbi:MAG TPA: LamG-like jellyroll fold domain-containing protein, partial [Candidatus Sulfotelmatobacter sp.]|nr:LamG-like jellyroll fold domain-containing protein [Candidatus Sulfotelmatobacter sp.]